MSALANAFLDSLDEGQLAKVQREFDSERKDWHFVPKNRDGLSLKEMSEEQVDLAYGLMSQGLSEQGLELVSDIRSLELVLQVMEGPGRAFPRDPDLYHVWIFGEPGDEEWAWRFEGHHVSLNATIVAGEGVSMTPTFLGTNPAKVPIVERKGHRALAQEEDLAFAFLESLSETQLSKAVFRTKAPNDIFSFVDRETKPLPIEGLGFGDLNAEQQDSLKSIVDLFLKRNRSEIRSAALAKIGADGWGEVSFGWAGSLKRGEGNYYFIQGSSFLIEYDNTQNNNNHIHCVWREFEGDFGEDLIRQHRHAHVH
ncbi:hypothetical protein VDG1235_2945 [Verrucomicrobiia bacterium DG1235]|nr:hypothetical protein VDG1235_2945 [Verrucomicrobiae bacterium DG1235]